MKRLLAPLLLSFLPGLSLAGECIIQDPYNDSLRHIRGWPMRDYCEQIKFSYYVETVFLVMNDGMQHFVIVPKDPKYATDEILQKLCVPPPKNFYFIYWAKERVVENGSVNYLPDVSTAVVCIPDT